MTMSPVEYRERGFMCSVCDKIGYPPEDRTFKSGYGTFRNGEVICYACCADRDRDCMRATGNSKALPLYLNLKRGHVTNWPGTLKFRIARWQKGRHNITGERIDVWFEGPDGFWWWGWNVGNTDIVHCRRTKEIREWMTKK